MYEKMVETAKKKKGQLIIATGSSLVGRKELFYPAFEKLCEKEKKKVKIYNAGSMIRSWIWRHTRDELNPETILDVNPLAIRLAHAAVLEEIRHSLKQDLEKNDAVLINLHTVFRWRDIWIRVFNDFFIKELIQDNIEPDMFICFIDLAKDILERVNQSVQWKGQKFTEDKIWDWQNVEIDNTRGLTILFDEKKKFFAMPVKQPPETLYYLLFEPWRPIIYAQMPITHVLAKELIKVEQFITQLRKWAIVIDPLTIETGVFETNKGDDQQVRIRHNQTAHRDTAWFIPQCDICIAYYVKVVFSAGVVDETATASQLGKQTWVIFPKDYSPFIPFRTTPDRIFQTAEEVIQFLEKEFIPQWTKKWKQSIDEE